MGWLCAFHSIFWECTPTVLWVSDSLSEAQSYNPPWKGTTGLEKQNFSTLSWALNAPGEKICANGILKDKSPVEEESRRVKTSKLLLEDVENGEMWRWSSECSAQVFNAGAELCVIGAKFSDKTSRCEFCFKAWPEPTLNNLKYKSFFFFFIILIGGVTNAAFNFMSE